MNLTTERNDRYEDAEIVSVSREWLILRVEPDEPGDAEFFAVPLRLLVEVEFSSQAEMDLFRKGADRSFGPLGIG